MNHLSVMHIVANLSHSIACLFIWQCLLLLRKFQFWCSQGYQIFSSYNLCFLISLLCYNDYFCIFFREFGNFALSYLSSSIWNLFCSSFEVEIEDFDCGNQIPHTIYRQLFPYYRKTQMSILANLIYNSLYQLFLHYIHLKETKLQWSITSYMKTLEDGSITFSLKKAHDLKKKRKNRRSQAAPL